MHARIPLGAPTDPLPGGGWEHATPDHLTKAALTDGSRKDGMATFFLASTSAPVLPGQELDVAKRRLHFGLSQMVQALKLT